MGRHCLPHARPGPGHRPRGREQAVYTEEGDSLEAVGELCTWLKSPSKTYMLARIHAETLLVDWLHGFLVRDALQTLSGIDARDVRTMMKQAK